MRTLETDVVSRKSALRKCRELRSGAILEPDRHRKQPIDPRLLYRSLSYIISLLESDVNDDAYMILMGLQADCQTPNRLVLGKMAAK